uniref:endo-1,4-beta-xylanase n=1 Tax=uncultured microorganism TaxID=358574 RepID=A0A7U1BNC8_9ZZZZ|nr:1,4-beta-xylanase [uncultured microorganism]
MSKKFILIGSIIILIVTGCAPVSVEPVTTPIIETRTSEVGPISDTPTAPVNTPTQSPSPTAEPTPTIEPTPTPSAEQIEQSIMDQFVSGPLYDQYIADNQIPEQAAKAFYNKYSGADGEPFAVVTMKVDPNSLSQEQKALNIPQRDYWVVKTADGQIEFKLLPVNLQLETFSQSAVEFTLSKEYQDGVQDYLNAMGLEAGAVAIAQTQKEVNGEEYRFLVATPDQTKMTIEQREYVDIYGEVPLFKCDEIERNLVGLKNFFSFGTSTIWDLLDTSKREYNAEREKYKKIFLKDFSTYTAQFGWEHIQPDGPEKFNFSILDWQFKELEKMGLYNDLNFTAQSLILQQPPDWLKNGNYNRDQIIELMQKYINTIISRYSGQIDQMVIVNEPAGNLRGWTRDDFFNSKIGPEYIDIAFQAARNADPNLILIFNDTDNHFEGGHTTQNTIGVVKRLKEKELIDGVGVQLHLDGARPFNKEDFIKTLKEYVGLPVYITEFDIDMSNVYGTLEQRQKIQARIAKLVMEGILESGVVVSFTMWEAPGDKFNWLENYLNKDKADGTFWTDELDPKQSYYAATQALWNSKK